VPPRLSLSDSDQKILLGLALTLGLIVLLGLVILLEPGRAERTARTFRQEAVSRGEELFAAHCTSCHGEEGRGDGETPASALNDLAFLESVEDQEIFDTVYHGRPGTEMATYGMSRGGPLGDNQVQDLVAFVRHWETSAEVLPTPTPYVNAQELYATRCTRCHGLTGEGTVRLPVVLRSRAYLDAATEDTMRQQIESGKPPIGMPACAPDLGEQEVAALIAFMEGWKDTLPAVVNGETLFGQYCSVCHGADGEGTPEVPLVLHSKSFLAARSDADLAAAIVRGRGAMPAWGREAGGLMTDEQVDGLVRFLRGWSGQPPVPPRVPDPGRGADLFATHCASCHGELGRGGIIVEGAINSADYLDQYGEEGLRSLIQAGIPGEAMPGFGDTLSGEEMDDLAALFRRWKWALLFQE